MSTTQISQETGNPQQTPAESSPNESSPESATAESKSRRKHRAKRDSASRVASNSSRKTPPAKPAEETAAGTPEPVPSVAELTGSICRNPENRRKRLKMSEALRECGMDESRFAATCFGLTEKLSRNSESGAVGVANAKLLLEVLKEVAHALEPQKTVAANESSDAQQFVRLVHNVPRPVRTE